MPADPPRILDDAVPADTTEIAALLSGYTALAGDWSAEDATVQTQKAQLARRQWATLALAIAGNEGAKATLLAAGSYTCSGARALADDEQDAQHELLRGALARVHLGDALNPDLSNYAGTIYTWMALKRVRLVRVLGNMHTARAEAAAEGAPVPYTLDAILGKTITPDRLARFLGSKFRKDVQSVIDNPKSTLAELTALAAPDDKMSEEQQVHYFALQHKPKSLQELTRKASDTSTQAYKWNQFASSLQVRYWSLVRSALVAGVGVIGSRHIRYEELEPIMALLFTLDFGTAMDGELWRFSRVQVVFEEKMKLEDMSEVVLCDAVKIMCRCFGIVWGGHIGTDTAEPGGGARLAQNVLAWHLEYQQLNPQCSSWHSGPLGISRTTEAAHQRCHTTITGRG